jgi:hypothetical protein
LTDDEFALALELEAEQAQLARATDRGGDALMLDALAANGLSAAGVNSLNALPTQAVGEGSRAAALAR